MNTFSKCLLSAVATLCSATASVSAQTVIPADTFVDSVGVNIHLNDKPALYYTNFPLIQNALVTLGVRHVRDALVDTQWQTYYDRLNALGQLGIKGEFITIPTQSTNVLQNWPTRVSQSFEAYEFPNEYDNVNGGIQQMQAFAPVLYNARNTGVAPNAPIFGPSLTQTASYSQMGDTSQYIDFGNLHDYFAGRNAGTRGWGPSDSAGHYYGSIAYALDYEGIVAGTQPVVTTETGYDNITSYTNYVDEATAAVYMPRLLMEQWLAGIKRTYIYELATDASRTYEDYGLMRTDGTYKPAFTAVSNLLNLLSDPGAPFTTTPLNFTISGGSSNLHNLLMQKRDGTYYLAVWVEAQSWDPDKHVVQSVAPQAVTLTLPNYYTNVNSIQFDNTGNTTTTALPAGSSFALTVTDKMQIIQIGAGTPQWQLFANSNPSTAGSLTLSPQTPNNVYSNGTSVVVTANAVPGYAFTGFTGGMNSSSNSITVSSNNTMSLTANYTCVYSLSATSSSFTYNGGSNSIPYSTGSTCNATPTTSASWLTASVSGGVLKINAAANTATARTGTVTLGGVTVSVNQDPAYVQAALSSNISGLYIYIDGKAYVVGSNVKVAGPGTNHTISAPSSQSVNSQVYLFQQWTQGLSGTALSQTITTPTTPLAFATQFIQANYLRPYATTGGTVTVSAPGTTYNSIAYYYPTDVVTLTATPNAGCTFTAWAGTTAGSSASLTLTMNQNYTETAKFSCK